MDAFAEGDRVEFQQVVSDLLRRKYAAELAGVSDAYVGGVAELASTTCANNDIHFQGDVIDFADALIKDVQHPLGAAELDARARVVLREFRAREVFLRLQALARAASGAAAGAADGGDDDDAFESNEE